MRRRFATLDVFTDTPFAGNPLAIVRDCEGLSEAAMGAIAREFNLSETVFLFPPSDPAHRARLRIFTPTTEIPFAGHPTVGAAVYLGLLDSATAARALVLEEKIGAVRCRVAPATDGRSGTASFALPRLPARTGDAAEPRALAEALSLTQDDLGCGGYLPARWSAGNEFTFVPLRGRDAIARAAPNMAVWDKTFGPSGARAAFLFCRETAQRGHDFHARMFAPHMGMAEDPATGSAVAAFAGLVAAQEELADGEHAFAVEQGYEMGRPSLIRLTMDMRRGRIVSAEIGGAAVLISEGDIAA